jgi:hypothetical protein
MRKEKSKKVTDPLTWWNSFNDEQKIHLFIIGPMLAAGAVLIVVLLGITGWSLIGITVSYFLGNPSDGFLLNVYYRFMGLEGLFRLIMVGIPIITFMGLSYLQWLSRKASR